LHNGGSEELGDKADNTHRCCFEAAREDAEGEEQKPDDDL
jgi:hypothetical protein